MEKIEKLYRLALKHKLDFTYRRNPTGTLSVILMSGKSELVFDFGTFPDGCEWIICNSKRYYDFESALRDYEDLLLLHRE